MFKKIVLISTIFVTSISCQKKVEEALSDSTQYLYVAAGLCYSGNAITTFTAATASNLVYRINTSTGQRDAIIADYQAAPATAGDTPTSVEVWNDSDVLVLVRNGTTGRAIESAPKVGGTRTNFGLNPSAGTILSTAPAAMKKTADGGLLIARTGFIEKVSSSGVRLGAPWVNSVLNGACGTSALITSLIETSSSKILATNAATGAGKINSIAATGGTTLTGCNNSVATPVAAAFPTAAVYDATNSKVIVAYGGSAAASNLIYAYDFDETTGAITNGQKIYDATDYPATHNFLLFGISAMTLDPQNEHIYVSTAISMAATVVNYNIEKLNYNPSLIGTTNSGVLKKTGTLPFYGYGVDTKCISSLKLGN